MKKEIEGEIVVMQWGLRSNNPVVWQARDDFEIIIDLPAEDALTKENMGRIDSFVAILDRPPPKPGEETVPDTPGFAKMVRINSRRIEFRFDPPEIRYAYRRWENGKATVFGDVGLWIDTFMLESIS